jgi:hypothetical protein
MNGAPDEFMPPLGKIQLGLAYFLQKVIADGFAGSLQVGQQVWHSRCAEYRATYFRFAQYPRQGDLPGCEPLFLFEKMKISAPFEI